MRKVIAVMVLLIAIAVPSFAAVTDMMANFTLTNSTSSMDITTANDVQFKFNIDLAADFNMIFDNGPGFDVALITEQNFNTIELGAYYAHKIDVNNDFDLIIMAGPRFKLASNFAVGVDCKVNFLIDMTPSCYISLGTGVLIDIVEFRNGDADTNVSFSIPLPSVGIGVRF